MNVIEVTDNDVLLVVMGGIKQAFTKDQIDRAIRQCGQQKAQVAIPEVKFKLPPVDFSKISLSGIRQPASALAKHAVYLKQARTRYPAHLLPAYVARAEAIIVRLLTVVEVRDYPKTLYQLKLAIADYEGLNRLADALAQIDATPHVLGPKTKSGRATKKDKRRQWLIDEAAKRRAKRT